MPITPLTLGVSMSTTTRTRTRTSTPVTPGAAVHTTVGRHPTAARRARIWARTTLCAWDVGGQAAADVELVVSELVTNALVHGRGRIRVDLAVTAAGELRVEVHDAGPAAPVHPAIEQATGGRGLAITRSLATGCGWDAAPDRSTAWATLPHAA
jgi:anti-sigma regulatory factor (Ser/Thr protein kinase)